MALSAGDRLGPYEILEAIGKGGMGEVYRARDTRLGRDVAVKVSDQKFGERFEREARVISSLNHPNICHLYDVGDNYLVMELVEGETLAARIERGAIPLEESLAIARQIADALEAAHEKGITHRDLKPGNVMVKEDGSVKVLDFGLAKVGPRAASGGDNADESPTISMAATQAGVILGTAAYMAPEQARGKPVDKRADIWAFGVLLYEMVTGQKLFKGEDLTETLAFVVTKDADLTGAPVELRRLLGKCLEKDPRKRLRDIGDVWGFLDEGRVQGPGEAAAQAARRPHAWLWPAVAAVLGVVAVVAGWVAWRALQPEDRPLARLPVDLGDVDLGAAGPSVVISPDGTRIAYVAAPAGGGPRQIYTRRLDQTEATAIAGTDGATTPFFSPDGEWIGFGQQGQLKKISVEGGAAVTLTAAAQFAGASWSENGVIVYGTALTDGLRRVPEGGGESESVAPLAEGRLADLLPQILQGGKAVLFTSLRAQGQTDVDVVSMDGQEHKTIVPGGSSARYLPSGHLIYLNNTTLFAVPFDVERLETRGSAIPILEGVGYQPSTRDGSVAFSRNGTLVYRSGSAPQGTVPRTTVEWLGARGNRTPAIKAPSGYAEVRISPDERRLALSVKEGSGNDHLAVYDLERGGFSPLTFDDRDHAFPVWSPDGRFVVFSELDSLLWTRADGAGQPQPLLKDAATLRIAYSFTPDGSRLSILQAKNNTDLWTAPVTIEGDGLKAGDPEEFLATQFTEDQPMFSPDGRWLAYDSNESGRAEVSVRAFPRPASGEGAKFAVSTDGGTFPVWSRKTQELFFRSLDGKIMVASYRVNGDNFVAERPRVWATLDGDLQGALFQDMASDGRALITVPTRTNQPQAAPEPQHNVVFLQNFFDYLRRTVPVE